MTEMPIDPSVPNALIPTAKIITPSSKQRIEKRNNRYLSGPIKLSWIREHIKSPADRLLLALCAHATMAKTSELKLGSAILKDAGIADRKAAYRAVEALEKTGKLSAVRHPGRRVVVRLLTPIPAAWI